jgi:hypothetical protein
MTSRLSPGKLYHIVVVAPLPLPLRPPNPPPPRPPRDTPPEASFTTLNATTPGTLGGGEPGLAYVTPPTGLLIGVGDERAGVPVFATVKVVSLFASTGGLTAGGLLYNSMPSTFPDLVWLTGVKAKTGGSTVAGGLACTGAGSSFFTSGLGGGAMGVLA